MASIDPTALVTAAQRRGDLRLRRRAVHDGDLGSRSAESSDHAASRARRLRAPRTARRRRRHPRRRERPRSRRRRCCARPACPARFTMQFTARSGCGLGRELVDELARRILVRHGHGHAGDPHRSHTVERSASVARGDVEGDVDPVHPRGLERRVEQDGRERVRDRVADHRRDSGRAGRCRHGQRTPFCSAILMFCSCSRRVLANAWLPSLSTTT